jgi:hypothetical protein
MYKNEYLDLDNSKDTETRVLDKKLKELQLIDKLIK